MIDEFKRGKVSCLVATDVAARGLDVSSIGFVLQADAPRNVDTYTHRIGRTGRAGRTGETMTILDSKSGFGIAAGLVDLLSDAGQSNFPAWLQGQAHIANARSLEEDMKIQAGSLGTQAQIDEVDSDITNDEFSQQDFRRRAVQGSYGSGKDTAYRNFEDEAYSDLDLDSIEQSSSIISSSERSSIDTLSDNGTQEEDLVDAVVSFEKRQPSQQLIKAVKDISGKSIGDKPDKSVLNALGRRSQKMKFEYLGLYPFHLVSPMLMTSQSNNDVNNEQVKVKILMVAEKPSIAQAIADALSGKRGARQLRGISRALPVYEFATDEFKPINEGENGKQNCLVRVTSVVGHVYSLAFDFGEQGQTGRSEFRMFSYVMLMSQYL